MPVIAQDLTEMSGEMSFCGTSISPQTEQWEPSVRPVLLRVGATAGSVTGVCPRAGMGCCAVMVSPQTEQWEPSVRPASVQVAALLGSVTGVWPLAGMGYCADSAHFVAGDSQGVWKVMVAGHSLKAVSLILILPFSMVTSIRL